MLNDRAAVLAFLGVLFLAAMGAWSAFLAVGVAVLRLVGVQI